MNPHSCPSKVALCACRTCMHACVVATGAAVAVVAAATSHRYQRFWTGALHTTSWCRTLKGRRTSGPWVTASMDGIAALGASTLEAELCVAEEEVVTQNKIIIALVDCTKLYLHPSEHIASHLCWTEPQHHPSIKPSLGWHTPLPPHNCCANHDHRRCPA